MKYIVMLVPMGPDTNREVPIMFPNNLVHDEVFERMKKLCDPKVVCIAAGEVSFFDGVTCSGSSETLNLVSRHATDEELIRMNDYFHGITHK